MREFPPSANDNSDVGQLLINMALDTPPPVHGPDLPGPVGSPLDALYNALVAAANGGDAANAAEAQEMRAQRQEAYRDAITGGGQT